MAEVASSMESFQDILSARHSSSTSLSDVDFPSDVGSEIESDSSVRQSDGDASERELACFDAAMESLGNVRLVPELTNEERMEMQLKTAAEQTDDEGGDAKEVKPKREKKVWQWEDGVDMELMAELAQKPLSYYQGKRDVPDAIVKNWLPDVKRRWFELEERVYILEDRLGAIDRPDRSLEEDRFEILVELLDKAAQGFEINDEHEVRNIPLGERIHLEARLMDVITRKFDIIDRIVDEFDKLKGDQDGANNEREFLRYEIRQCDLEFTLTHEYFLKSYLGMPWP
ncbi:unnamed protein product, partial [Mesorhabditis spiculigera]